MSDQSWSVLKSILRTRLSGAKSFNACRSKTCATPVGRGVAVSSIRLASYRRRQHYARPPPHASRIAPGGNFGVDIVEGVQEKEPAAPPQPPASPPSVARRFARFVSGLRLDDVPRAVTARATLLALVTLGSGLASSGQDFGRAVTQAAERLGGPPESTLIGSKQRVGAAAAVLANGTLAHGLDFDDTREDAIVHTGCVAVTTALAVGEAVEATGREVLEATIASVEIMCRIGLAVPGRFHARHYHRTALTGSLAGAAAAGRPSPR